MKALKNVSSISPAALKSALACLINLYLFKRKHDYCAQFGLILKKKADDTFHNTNDVIGRSRYSLSVAQLLRDDYIQF